jgi:hypothetical protein
MDMIRSLNVSFLWHSVLLASFVWLAGCSLLDRQKDPQILEVRTDQDEYESVGRGKKVRVSLFTDDPDNDELDYLWIASGGVFEQSGLDTLVDLFQDSVTVIWRAPGAVGVYDLMVEVSDGKSGTSTASTLQIFVTQGGPTADAGGDQVVGYTDTLEVVLDGRNSSDPDRDDLRFVWEQIGGPGVTLTSGASGSPSFGAVAAADYVFVLQVRDDIADTTGSVTSTTDTVIVRVNDRGGRGF